MRDVLNALWDARSKWYSIGIELNIHPDDLDAIDSENSNPDDCLRSLIHYYLKSTSHKIHKSWTEIIHAMRSPPINFQVLASELESRFLEAQANRVTTTTNDAGRAIPGT